MSEAPPSISISISLRIDRAETYLSMDRRLAGAKGCFFVQAKGNELGPIEVAEGDYLLVEPTSIDEVEEDALVVARVGGQIDHHEVLRLMGKDRAIERLSSAVIRLSEVKKTLS